MSKRGILALEDDMPVGFPATEMTEQAIDNDVLQARVDTAEVVGEMDQLQESASMAAQIDTMAETAEAAVERGDGLAPETVKTMESAMEHFCLRLGVTKRAVPSMESFDKDRLGSTKQTLANLRSLSERTHERLELAQEGFFDRLKNSFSRAFTPAAKMRAVVARLDVNDLVDKRDLGEPAWGRVFGGITKKNEINGDDVARVMDDLQKHGHTLAKALDRGAAKLEEIAYEMGKKLIGSDDETVERIKKLGDEIIESLDKATHSIPRDLSNDKQYARVVSCDKAAFSKIAKAMQDHRVDDDLYRALNRWWEAIQKIEPTKTGNARNDSIIAVGSWLTSGARRAARHVISNINDEAEESALILSAYMTAARHGAYKYLLASTKK